MSSEAAEVETPTESAVAVARWTGGQYSLFRFTLATYLAVMLLSLLLSIDELAAAVRDTSHPVNAAFPSVFQLRSDRPVMLGVIVTAAVLCVPLAIGWKDRFASVAIWYLWACLYMQSPELLGNAFPCMGWILLAHLCVPAAPFGSVDARGRADPRGDWSLPAGIPLAIWLLLAVMQGYFAWSAWQIQAWRDGTAVGNLLKSSLARDSLLVDAASGLPAGLLAVASWIVLASHCSVILAIIPRLRPFVWLVLVTGKIVSLLFLSQTSYSAGMLVLLVLAFDPKWVRPTRPPDGSTDWLFYDGDCGLCHRSIRLVLAEGPGNTIHFAPLGSEAFERELTEEQRTGLPDSVVVKTGGQVLVRSEAAVFVLRRLGGWWRVLGEVARRFPRRLGDALYDTVAKLRMRLFAKPKQACPLLPPDLRSRFELS